MCVSRCFDSNLNGSEFTRQLDFRCNKTGWLDVFYFTFATFFAQLAVTLRLVTTSGYLTPTAYLTPRVYAVTGRSRWIASCLSFTTFAQVVFGTGLAIYYASHPGTISSLRIEKNF